MDSFFGIGAPELILILLLAGIVMGPERIGRAARWLGKTTAQLQAISRQFMRQLNSELASADQDGELKGALDDIQALRRQVTELRQEITTSAMEPFKEGETAVQEGQKLVKETLSLKDKDADTSENRIAGPTQTALPNLIEIPDDPE